MAGAYTFEGGSEGGPWYYTMPDLSVYNGRWFQRASTAIEAPSPSSVGGTSVKPGVGLSTSTATNGTFHHGDARLFVEYAAYNYSGIRRNYACCAAGIQAVWWESAPGTNPVVVDGVVERSGSVWGHNTSDDDTTTVGNGWARKFIVWNTGNSSQLWGVFHKHPCSGSTTYTGASHTTIANGQDCPNGRKNYFMDDRAINSI
jgi:hypothetical protein